MFFFIKKFLLINIAFDLKSKLFKNLTFILFLILGIFLFQEILVHFYETFVTGRPHNHKLGDWAINYNDGFVRRGLVGQILLYLDWHLSISLLNSLFFFPLIVVFSFYFFLLNIFLNLKNKSLFWFFLFLSPSFLLFSFYDFEGGFRKENLGFLSFSILIFSFTVNANKKFIIISIIVYLVAAFSHEMNSFFLLFYISVCYYLYSNNKISFNFLIFTISSYSLISILSIIISFIFSGVGHSPGICETVTNTGIHNNICGGSIFVLEKDILYYISKTFQHFPNYPIYYTPLLIFAILPIFIVKNFFKVKFLILISFLSILPLFFIAADWGRWISVFATYAYIFLMMVNLNYRINVIKINALIVFIFILSWYVPVYNINSSPIDIFNNIEYIINPIVFINNPGEYLSMIDIFNYCLEYIKSSY